MNSTINRAGNRAGAEKQSESGETERERVRRGGKTKYILKNRTQWH